MVAHLIVQDVTDVEPATTPLEETSPKEALEQLLGTPVEACSEYAGQVVPFRLHPFVGAVHAAFASHRPLVLSPDMFWLLIAQGFALHIDQNAKSYRSQFVNHQGKQTISVRRDDFIKGSLENPWAEVFDEFSRQIKQHIGEDNHANIVVGFSTTGPIEKAANEVVLMYSMKNYFDYRLMTVCGIPQVRLEGRLDDWVKLRDRTAELGRAYNLHGWTDQMLPTLDAIADNAAGTDDPQLWERIYKWRGGSGGPHVDGWITDFFPYLQAEKGALRRNGFCRSVTSDAFPASLCKAPFTWQYHATEYPMEFVAGFTSFTQEADTYAVRPKIGWAVRDKPEAVPRKETTEEEMIQRSIGAWHTVKPESRA